MISLRLPSRDSIRRRLAALAAAFCVVGAQGELLLPDLHDGDAVVAHVVGADSHEEPARGPTEAPAPQSSHAVHVDHCVHAHVLTSSEGSDDTFLALSAMDAPATATPFLASVTAAPHSRPPIA